MTIYLLELILPLAITLTSLAWSLALYVTPRVDLTAKVKSEESAAAWQGAAGPKL